MVNNTLDLALLLQVSDGNSRQATVYFESLDEDTLTNETEGGDLLHNTVVRGLVKDDSVLRFVLDLSLGPLLLFR